MTRSLHKELQGIKNTAFGGVGSLRGQKSQDWRFREVGGVAEVWCVWGFKGDWVFGGVGFGVFGKEGLGCLRDWMGLEVLEGLGGLKCSGGLELGVFGGLDGIGGLECLGSVVDG